MTFKYAAEHAGLDHNTGANTVTALSRPAHRRELVSIDDELFDRLDGPLIGSAADEIQVRVEPPNSAEATAGDVQARQPDGQRE